LPVSPISADICRYDIGKAEGLSGTVSGKKKCRRYRIGADICHSDIGNIGEPAKSGTALELIGRKKTPAVSGRKKQEAASCRWVGRTGPPTHNALERWTSIFSFQGSPRSGRD